MQLRQWIPEAGLALGVLASAAAAQSASSSPTGIQGRVPLAAAVATLPQPPGVWQRFYELTQIARPSRHEAKATAFMLAFGRRLGLETSSDAAGNVIIRKPATPGLEGRPSVVLQGHLDMVPQKTPASQHNFLTDPINAYVENGWVRADGTTLGADDGIGVAIIMAILQNRTLAHGPIEALFTTNEEDGFGGITALAANALRSKTLINIDNEDEGQFVISSAGGIDVNVSANYAEQATPVGLTGLSVAIDGLIGGHSGMDINKGRGSAHQLMARLLVNAPAELGLRLARLTGGTLKNGIPSATRVELALPTQQAATLTAYVDSFQSSAAKELAASDPGLRIRVTAIPTPSKVLPLASQQALLKAVLEAPQGVYRMSAVLPDLVETSGNIGILNIGDGKMAAAIYVRSAQDSERDALAQRFVKVFAQGGASAVTSDAFASWPPKPDSPVLALMRQQYKTLFAKEARVVAIHAGLETSVAGIKFPDLDMISVGPTMHDPHSPDERLEVASVQKVYDLITATLAQIK